MTLGPLLLIGGYGVTGREVARLLRARQPDLPLVIAGRDPTHARDFAAKIGAEARAVDLDAGSDLFGELPVSGVIVMAKDAGLRALRSAQRRATPYLSLSSAAFELGVDLVQALANRGPAPIVMAGHWSAGAVTTAAVALASSFDTVDSILAGVTIDRNAASGGKASIVDFERVERSISATLARIDGNYVWLTEPDNSHSYRNLGGKLVDGKGAVSIDVASIGARVDAPNIRVLETWGDSTHFTETGIPADEVIIETAGVINGQKCSARQTLQLPHPITSLTALSLVITIERLLGLDGAPPAPGGVWTPDQLFAGDAFMASLKKGGVRVETSIL